MQDLNTIRETTKSLTARGFIAIPKLNTTTTAAKCSLNCTIISDILELIKQQSLYYASGAAPQIQC